MAESPTNRGLPPEPAPKRPASGFVVGCLILVWGALVLWGLFLLAMLSPYLRPPSDVAGGGTPIYGFLFGVLPWLVVLVITAAATWRLRRRR